MSETPPVFVRVSTPDGHFTVPAAVAERAGSEWRVLKQDALDYLGNPLPPKLREDKLAATPSKSEAPASDDTKE
jgi:hypothetical protein